MTNEEKEVERRDSERRQSERRAETAVGKIKQSRSSSIWIILSFVITAAIIGWGFSLPFRKHERPLLVWDESDLPGRGPESVRKVKLTKEEIDAYREIAIQRDREFLRQRRERLRQTANLPGREEAKATEKRRVASLQKKIAELHDAPKGSLEAQYREDLKKSLENRDDVPE